MGLGRFNASMLSGSRNNNNGGNGNRNDRKSRKERRREERNARSSVRNYNDRTFDDYDLDNEYDDSDGTTTESSKELDYADKILQEFIDDFADIIQEPGNRVANVIRDGFWDVANVMTHYYDNKYKELTGKMNKVLEIVSRMIFAKSLQIVCSNDDIDGWDGPDGIWKDVLFTLSTALITCHGKMKAEVISMYIDMISSNGLAGKDITMLVDKYGISKDLAIDLITSIPTIPEDLNDVTIGEFHNSFIMRIMENAEDNIDVLDKGTQDKLFTFFFGDGQSALKAVGRMLSDTVIGKFKNNCQSLIYKEYIAMLAKRLESYDIKNIKYVLKFISAQKKSKANDELVYESISLADYDSIRKALLELIKDNPEIKEILA